MQYSVIRRFTVGPHISGRYAISAKCKELKRAFHELNTSTVEPLLKDTPNKGHNRFIKDIFCGHYKTMVILFYDLMRTIY